jgi:putative tricarboxylic transport membrane protein
VSRSVWRNSIDFYSGLLLIAIAAGCLWLVSDLEMGSSREMGPAYFPATIAIILGGMGAIMLVRGFVVSGQAVGHIEMRPMLLVLASFLAFALLVTWAGLIIAIVAQVAIAHFASTETKPLESVLFAVGLAAFSAIVFVYLLGIPMSLLP